jgi:hypothetical protein
MPCAPKIGGPPHLEVNDFERDLLKIIDNHPTTRQSFKMPVCRCALPFLGGLDGRVFAMDAMGVMSAMRYHDGVTTIETAKGHTSDISTNERYPRSIEAQAAFRQHLLHLLQHLSHPPIASITSHRTTKPRHNEGSKTLEKEQQLTHSPPEPQVFPHQGQAGQGPEVQPPHSPMDPSPYRKHDQVNPPSPQLPPASLSLGKRWDGDDLYSLRPQAPEQLLITSQIQRQEEALEKDPYRNLDDSLSGF